MKLQIASDLHIEFDAYNANKFNLPKTDADVIILAGDIWNQRKSVDWAAKTAIKHEKPVIMVLGNHDYWSTNPNLKPLTSVLAKIYRRALHWQHKKVPIYLLENTSVNIDGTYFLGATLWTDYDNGNPISMMVAQTSMNDFNLIGGISGKLTAEHLFNRHKHSIQWLEKYMDSDSVVITHHSPSLQTAVGKDSGELMGSYYSDLDYAIHKFKPKLWVYGHTHISQDMMIDKTRIVSNPRGYAPYDLNKEFIPDKIVTI